MEEEVVQNEVPSLVQEGEQEDNVNLTNLVISQGANEEGGEERRNDRDRGNRRERR